MARMVLPPEIPHQGYDLMLTLTNHESESLQAKLKNQPGLIARKEIRPADVLLVRAPQPDWFSARVSSGGTPACFLTSDQNKARLVMTNAPLSSLAATLENIFHKPVFDTSGMAGHYNLALQWDTRDQEFEEQRLVLAQLAQAGLELVPRNVPMETLIVEKDK